MRVPVVVANWKMHKTTQEAIAYVREFEPLVRGVSGVEIVLAPAFTALAPVADITGATTIDVAAQNLYFEREGAFTGEVSADMIKAAGASWVIVGHSERRQLFGENDVWVNRKVRAAIAAELAPIMCIGETLAERERNQTDDVLDAQLKLGLEDLRADDVTALVIAYEPVWAIGTGRNATPAEASEAHEHIRGRLRQWFGAETAAACRILYGGSVKPANAASLLGLADVDGALVGGASLDAKGFAGIVRAASAR